MLALVLRAPQSPRRAAGLPRPAFLPRLAFLPLSILTALAAPGLCRAAPPVVPQITEYTSRAAFLAATTGVTTFTFDSLAPSGGSADYPNGVTVQGVTFDSPGGFLSAFDAAAGSGNAFGGHQFVTDNGSGSGIDITLPAAATAFGLDLTSAFNAGSLIVTTGGQNLLLSVPDGGVSPTAAFIGFTSAAPLGQISVTNSQFNFSQGVNVGRVSVGQTATHITTPEASPLTVFALGSLGLGALAAARRKRSA